MKFIESIDPIIMQLLVVPIIVIGIGILLSIFTRRIYIGPIATLILTLSYNYWYFTTFFPDSELSFTMVSSWCIIFPLISLYLSWLVSMQFKSIKALFEMEPGKID
ncbi:hypothetical protein ACQKDD_12175 [Planococcus kocurii]|uniref:L-lactate permease n=1 Tax=Planococcus kocurii TaxID=1374 RepID=A0ABM5WW80_9BACL|nr:MULTISPECIES: hypothetical protein [Planococcus]ALS78602.1 hypothetical protein AUO94_07965 [Planococcus kocurii]KAA0956476.1 hypothetical protein FQ085_13315 [Planococcus sp. ANT_H30]